jgi:hypothetical protein
MSGPHDFAVRFMRVRLSRQSVHRIPVSTSVTIAKRPSRRDGIICSIAVSTKPSRIISENPKLSGDRSQPQHASCQFAAAHQTQRNPAPKKKTALPKRSAAFFVGYIADLHLLHMLHHLVMLHHLMMLHHLVMLHHFGVGVHRLGGGSGAGSEHGSAQGNGDECLFHCSNPQQSSPHDIVGAGRVGVPT